MIKHIYKNSDILFVGINPHFGSFDRGVPFSNNKMFWYLLDEAGLINEGRERLKNDKILKEIYHKKFSQVYKLGLINMIDRASRDISDLKKGEEVLGQKRLSRIITLYSPKIVCFVGKVSYEKFTGLKKFDYGWKESIKKSKIFVMHTPLRGEARIRVEELQKIKKSIKYN